jgi:heme oxygenase
MHGLEAFQSILEERLPLNDYLKLLLSLLDYHSTMTAAASQFGWTNLCSGTRRVALLHADIRSVGGFARNQSRQWKPGSPEEALGALYAAEGSMLGGRVIAGQLDYLFGSALLGRSFFVGHKDDALSWRRLLATLEARCAGSREVERAIKGALFSFELFERCLITSFPTRSAVDGPLTSAFTRDGPWPERRGPTHNGPIR